MTAFNIGIASVLSDPFEKTSIEIISFFLEYDAGSMDEKAIRRLIHKGAKAKPVDIFEAIKGYRIEADQAKN